MGFYIRKSFSFGPLRFNLSKSGLGASVGVKGARVSVGPRGTYVHMGRHGLYYKQRLDSSARPTGQAVPPVTSPEVETAEVTQLVDSSSRKLISQINAGARRMPIVPFAIASLLLSVLLLKSSALAAAGAFLAGLVFLSWSVQRDRRVRTTDIFYELEGKHSERFSEIRRASQQLAAAQRKWRVDAVQPNWDWKHNAGASSLITRSPVTVERIIAPPFIATNVEIWGIKAKTIQLMFFPDYLFVLQDKKYGTVAYEALNIAVEPTRFIEDDVAPSDAAIVGYKWKFPRKDGGPDRRFANNRQLPVALYGHLTIWSGTGLNVHFQISNLDRATAFVAAFSRQNAGPIPHQQESTRSTRPPADVIRGAEISPYKTLGIREGASSEEIVSSYRRMAQMYHPDKVAGLGPELREIADRRMKEINAAYEQLKEHGK